MPELEERPGMEKWTGDLDGIKRRGILRALVCYNEIFYFFDKGKARGVAAEALGEFETFLNKKLNPKDRKGTQKIQVVLIPVSHREIFQALVEGRGDIAVANLSISPEPCRSRRNYAGFAQHGRGFAHQN